MTKNNEIENIIKLALIRIGLKCDAEGFTFLSKAIVMVIEEPYRASKLSKTFNEIAEIYNVKNPFRVEANIQNVMTATFNSKTFVGVNKLFGVEIYERDYKPTISEFVKLMVEYYNMGIYKRDFVLI